MRSSAEISSSPGTPLLFETLEPRLLLAADLTAGYAFNETSGTTAADASGHNIAGTLTNGPIFAAGKYGNAVVLDGANDYVNLGNPAALQLTGSMTISAWVFASAFPVDDAAVVSKRGATESGFQLDITKDTGPRTIGFKLTDNSGGTMFRYGATTLQLNTWYHIAGVYNAAAQTLDVYLNGVLDNGQLLGTVTASQVNSTSNVTIGRRSGATGYEFAGSIDDARIYSRALTQAEIQDDMVTPLAAAGPDTTAPTVALTAPAGSAVAGTVTVTATASDNIGVVGVQFLLDGNALNAEDTTSPYSVSWNTTTAANGTHTLAAVARDAAGNTATTSRSIIVDNQAPTGTVTINSGAAATNTRNVTLSLAATDALSTVTNMRFSNTGTSFSAAEAFSPTKAWTLSAGAGTKTVYVQFQDALGNWSTAVTDTIVLDTTAPTISGRTASSITSSSAVITWTTNELATSQVNYGPTTSYGLTTTLDPILLTSHSVTLTGLAPNTTYNYRVRSIDAAGNETVSANTTFTTAAGPDIIAPTVAVSAPAANAIVAGIITISATASDNVGVVGVQFFVDGVALIPEDTSSPYSMSWDTTTASNGTHTITARARDAATNSTLSAPITVTVDNEAPTGTVVINSGAALTNSTTVTLALVATDGLSGVTQMRFSNDGTTFSAAESFAATKVWTLTAGDGTKTVYAQFRDAAGNWSSAATDTIVLDATGPTISATTATIVTTTGATITWTTNEGGSSQVDYGLTTSYGSTTTPDPTLLTSHSVALSGLTPNTTYNFRVRSVDAAGNVTVSVNSAFTTAAVPDNINPTTPTGLTALAVSATQVNLAWTASTDNVAVTGYQVFRDGVQVATTATTSYNDTGLTANTQYSYSVKAFDAAGNLSALSAVVNATTQLIDTAAPSVPTGLVATVVSSTQITLAWNASTDNVAVTGYQVFRDGIQIATTTGTSYSNTGLTPNTPYVYAVKAYDAANNVSALSATANATTLASPQTAGLTAGYAFDEASGTAAADASGNSIIGTLTNGPTFVVGKYGNAISLDGVDDYVNLGNPAALQMTGSMTVSAWIYSSSFPADDAAVVSKRAAGEGGFQLDTTADTGPRTIGFKLTNSSGVLMARYGATTLQANTWYYVSGVYNAAAQTLDVYLNGQLDNGVLTGTVTASQQGSTSNVNIGRRAGATGFEFAGRIDEARIYGRALTQSEIQADMVTALGQGQSNDPTPPQVVISSPIGGTLVSDIVTVTADASDNVAVGGVQFFVDGVLTGPEDTTNPYALTWDTRTVSNGAHALTALARDVNGNTTLSAPIMVNVANTNYFRNEVLATGFDLPTAIKFLPDGRMLVVELQGVIRVLPAPYTTPDPTPFLQLTNVGSAGVQQGIYDIALDPNFATNHYYYIFYTLGNPNHDRLSRFTANAALTGTVAGSELVLYEDPQNANAEHHGGAINFGNDGKIYFTTGEHFDPAAAQLLSSPRGKIHRINPDGTVPTDNPFYDGAGPNWDSIWALGLRNPYRAYYDAPTGRLIIGDVGGNDYSTAIEEVNIGARGANYGWPNVETPNGNPAYTAPAYYYAHNGREAAVTGGFVYHGTQFPSSYQGSYFFADYTQNWIKRLTFDANGNVTGVFNFEPADGSVDGPYGDIVYLTEGPEGALYYVDLGYSDIGGTFGVSKIRRISYVNADLPPVAVAAATPSEGAPPLTVSFSSAGSSDPEGHALTYLWTFGDGTTSTAANPTHTYAVAGQYQARLTVSDSVNTTFSTPLTIAVGNRPVITNLTPTDGGSFRAGDVISFGANATDTEDGVLPASAYTWNIDFLHEGHVHPGTPIVGVTGGTFTIPTSGHDFSGFTRYRITLTVTDSNGLQTTQSTTVFPDKVNLTFDTLPGGLTLYVDGIAHTAPFVYDTLIGFNHTIEARNQTVGATTYNFASWSDGGTQQHVIVAPTAAQSYTATYNAVTAPRPLAFVQVNAATPQTNQSQVSTTYTSAQVAGDTNIIAIGWNNATSNITSITDTAGNVYVLAVPVARGTGISQAIYYANNIKAAAAGTNTVTVTFNTATPYVDLRITEYSGLDPVNPLDVGRSASGTSATANSGAVTTTAANELIFAAGITTGGFSTPGANFTTRIITQPDLDIVEDRFVTTAGSYSATASLSGSAAWIMQVVGFRAAVQP